MGDDAEGSAGAMRGLDSRLGTAENFRRFGEAARGRSPAYGRLAEAVAADTGVLDFLDGLPVAKRQPNLLFAAARYLLGTPPGIDAVRRLVRERADELAAVLRARRTQTNEPARCATLLPALAGLPEPLALLEVGASAGLTLLPDHYSYDYAGHALAGDPGAPTLACRPHGPVPLPDRLPTVAWRRGLDVNPLDPADADDARWLECLVWPGEGDREARLRAALDLARRHPVPVHRGDLVDDLARVAADAPSGATLVVYHSAVLAYVDAGTRRAFAAAVRDLGAVWLSNEAPGVLPGTEATGRHEDPFLLVRDGREVLAATDPHGTWIDWSAR
ncbi:DUF2332 domain-containing protein [Saccharopolyspora cebuensis]|uniref:DUF2332 domain-containing protein n=1 Tax=Saccharopolyspora cebuensis TaxID=418759 RepID=A0ABV4CG17_9PSEU